MLNQQSEQTLVAEFDGLAEVFSQGGLPSLVQTVSDRSRRYPERLYLLIAPDGSLIAGNLTRRPINPDAAETFFSFAYDTLLDGEFLTQEALGAEISIGETYRLFIGRNIYEQRRLERLIVGALFLCLFVTLFFGVLVAIMISFGLIERIERINQACTDIMSGNLSRRINVEDGKDELDQLARQVNAMLDRIEGLMFGMRRFTDNVAHELRNPLNRIRNRLEVTLANPRAADDYQATLEASLRETDYLIKTFNALLSIAQAEAGALRESMDRIDLGELVIDVCDLYEPLAEEKGLTFDCAVEGGLIVNGNREMLAQAAANLIDNAIKYTPRDGQVQVTVGRQKKSIDPGRPALALTVRDTGPGIARHDRDRVFDRFVRLDDARSEKGAGLGLSLVSAIAGLHDARIVLNDNPSAQGRPGLRVTLIFRAPRD
ncbi:MAG: ATP-binding protein [Pseudomonadota bacterium]